MHPFFIIPSSFSNIDLIDAILGIAASKQTMRHMHEYNLKSVSLFKGSMIKKLAALIAMIFYCIIHRYT